MAESQDEHPLLQGVGDLERRHHDPLTEAWMLTDSDLPPVQRLVGGDGRVKVAEALAANAAPLFVADDDAHPARVSKEAFDPGGAAGDDGAQEAIYQVALTGQVLTPGIHSVCALPPAETPSVATRG